MQQICGEYGEKYLYLAESNLSFKQKTLIVFLSWLNLTTRTTRINLTRRINMPIIIIIIIKTCFESAFFLKKNFLTQNT